MYFKAYQSLSPGGTAVLTGGSFTANQVLQLSGLDQAGAVLPAALPSLATGRARHACGAFTRRGNMVAPF